MLCLRLLGPVDIRLNQTSLVKAGRDKGWLLLAYLAATAGQPHAREDLAALFWPRLPRERGLHNLRQILLRLHGLLPEASPRAPPILVAEAHRIRLERDADVWIDVDAFFRPSPDDNPAALERRAALYRGPFLDGMDAFIGARFDAWLGRMREDSQTLALALEEKLARIHEAAGRTERAVHHAQRCVSIDPWREAAGRRVMRLLAACGQQAAALRHFDALHALLRDELGCLPEPETVRLAERIRLGEADSGAAPDARLASERRPVAVLDCALACRPGCTADCADPESLAARLAPALAQARAVVERAGGSVHEERPNGLTALFGWPHADEHASRQAARCALSLRHELADADAYVALSVGLDSGLMLVDPAGSGAWEVTERARRLRFAAEPDAIRVGAAARNALRGRFALRAVTPPAAPWPAWQLGEARTAGPDATAARPDRPLVGRDEELERLAAAWTDARRGRVRVLVIRGEAGLGKSRLLQAFLHGTGAAVEQVVWLEAAPHGAHTPLMPVVQALRRRLNLPPLYDQHGAAEPDAQEGALYEALQALSDDETARRLLPLLHTATPAPAPGRKPVWLQALGAVLLPPRQPGTVVLDDAQWADASTLEWLDHLLAAPRSAGLLLVLATRTPLDLPPALARRAETLALAPLDTAAAQRLAGMLEGEPAREIVELCAGVPLFIVELAQMRAAGANPEHLPASVQELLAARLEQAGAQRELAQLAAIMGQEIDVRRWRQLASRCGLCVQPFDEALAELVDRGLLEYAPDADRVRFTHALLQRCAVAGLPHARRIEFHRLCAALLEGEGEAPERIAQHLSAAQLPAEAAEWWLRAARQAVRMEAYVETAQLAERALAAGGRRETELGATLLAAYARMAMGGYNDALAQTLYARARGFVTRSEAGLAEVLATLRGHWLGASSRASFQEARAIAEEMCVLAEGGESAHARGVAHYLAGNTALWQGDFAAARARLERAVGLLRKSPVGVGLLNFHDQNFLATATGYLGWACWFAGDSARALALGREGVRLGRDSGHTMTRLHTQASLCSILMGVEDAAQVLEHADAMLAQAEASELAMWVDIARLNRAWALARQGETGAATEVCEALARLCESYPGGAAAFYTIAAEIALFRGRMDEAAQRMEHLRHSVTRTGAGLFAAPLQLLEGEFEHRRGRRRQARSAYRRALTTAHTQRSPALELLVWREWHARLPDTHTRAGLAAARMRCAPLEN